MMFLAVCAATRPNCFVSRRWRHKAADLCARVVLLDDLECNLAVRVFHFFYNLLAQEHVKLAAFRIHVDDNVFVARSCFCRRWQWPS